MGDGTEQAVGAGRGRRFLRLYDGRADRGAHGAGGDDVLEGMFNAENVRTPRYPAKGAPRRAEGLRGPDHIHADRERSFMSAEMRRWAAQPERAMLVTAAAKGHPQGNGMAEKHVQNIKRATMAR